MGKILRWILGIAASGVLISAALEMFAEPFWAAVYQRLGINSAEWADPMIDALFSVGGLIIGAGIVGAATGAWAHWLALKFDRTRSALVKPVSKEIINQSYEMCTVPVDGRRFIQCRFYDVTFHWDGDGNFEFIDCKIAGRRGVSVKSGVLGVLMSLLKTLKVFNEDFAENMKVTPRDD